MQPTGTCIMHVCDRRLGMGVASNEAHGSIKAWFLPLRVYEENAVIYGKIKMADFVYWFDFVIVVALCVRTSS